MRIVWKKPVPAKKYNAFDERFWPPAPVTVMLFTIMPPESTPGFAKDADSTPGSCRTRASVSVKAAGG